MGLRKKHRRISVFIGIGTFILAAYWYQFSSNLLKQEEIEAYMATYQEQAQSSKVRHDMAALRLFLEQDDGLPFYTVNLYKFHDQADYQNELPHNVTGLQAYEKFSAVMLRLLAVRASQPIFGSTWSDSAASGWDRVVIVRYRSRRDMADLFASDEFAVASKHKWAAIKQNERLLVHGLHLPDGLVIASLLAIIAALIVNSLLSIARLRRPVDT